MPGKRGGRTTGPASFKRTRLATSKVASADRGAYARKVTNKVELKRVSEQIWTEQDLSTSGILTALPAPADGDLASERNGRAIKTKYFQWMALAYRGIYVGSSFRLIFFSWHNPRNPPVVGDILSYAAGSEVFGTYNDANAGSYKILEDKMYNLSQQAAVGSPPAITLTPYLIGGVVNNEAMQTFYDTTESSVADVSYYVLGISDQADNIQISMRVAQSFIDI